MDTPARLRLYQYAYSPYCIPIALILRHSEIPYEVVDMPACDPTQVIQLTKGEYYQVPVIEDLFTHDVIYDRSPSGDDVPRYILSIAPLMNLFPAEVQGLQQILVSYIENDCEAWSFKVCDAYCERWLKNDLERGLLRRHKERKFGPGCIEEWGRNINQLVEGFYQKILPFEHILAGRPFLTGDRPVFADYALCGVIGNFLFPGVTSLPANCLMLEAWYTKMRSGNIRNSLDEIQTASHDQFSERADQYGKSHILADVSDVEKAITELKLRPGTTALDVATGNGHTALYLTEKGLRVTACDISAAMLQQAGQLAAEKNLKIDFYEHPAEKLPYPDNSFGLVTCRVAAHHFSSPESFIRETSRVMKMYGYLVLIDGTVPDDQIEADEWLNAVEKLRDPSHNRFITPNTWRKWCVEAGLTVTRAQVESFKQPDLNWYFNVANTPPENRKKVLEMLAKAPPSARGLFRIGQEEGKIVWYWRRLTLVAGKI
ncbi:MAG TPA: methyltransferase domain-containing protein [Candidatus Methylacidiphilales bacterium]|nr:methyltransferase domain-containing protein [Candidatus Methylacidiphilales bacterium]